MGERKPYNFTDTLRGYSDRKLQEIVRQAQEVLNERKLTRNDLVVEKFLEIHNSTRGCQLEIVHVGYEPSGFFDVDGLQHSASIARYFCHTHRVSSQTFWNKIC